MKCKCIKKIQLGNKEFEAGLEYNYHLVNGNIEVIGHGVVIGFSTETEFKQYFETELTNDEILMMN